MTNFILENFNIMGYNLKNARNGKSGNGKSEFPIINAWKFKSLDFSKNKKIFMEKVVEKIPLQQHFPYKLSKFSANSNCHISLLFNARGLKLCYFRCTLYISGILQVTVSLVLKFYVAK